MEPRSPGGSSNYGTVFSINTDGTGFATLYHFTGGNDGATPQDGLVLSGNTLYGAASSGGGSDDGTIFSINPNGTGFATLHTFNIPRNGAQLKCTLILSNDTLYGTARGTVFSVNINGTGFTVLHSFPDTPDNVGELPAISILSGSTLYGTTEYGGSSGNGTVFAINTDGTGFTTLHSFTAATTPYPHDTVPTNSDGANPMAGLILSGDTLYGTASEGGISGGGAVFGIDTNGSDFITLHSFTGADGFIPSSGLILSNNILYGTASQGGLWNFGAVFSIGADGLGFINLHSFSAYETVFPENASLTLSSRTLYGTASDGAISGAGEIFSLRTDGSAFTNLYSFTNGSDGGDPLASLTLSGIALYGAASMVGNSNDGTIFSINTNGSDFTTLHSFTGGDGANPQASLTPSGSTLYGTSSTGGSSNDGTIFSINTNGSGFTTLHSFTGADGANPKTGLTLSGKTLYGTAPGGGSSGNVTVFAVNTDGTSVVSHK